MSERALRAALLAGRRRPVVRGGSRPFPARGDGYEIAELRGYVAGDDPRRIDWAASARAAALQVRVLLEERAHAFASIVDVSPSMRIGRRRSLIDAAFDANDRWFDACEREDRAIRIHADHVDAPRLRGPRAVAQARERMPSGPFDLDAALRLARAALPRDAYLLVASDFLEPLDDDVLRALGVHADVTALVARDPWFDGLPLHGFARIRDAESGAMRLLFIGAAQRRAFHTAVRERERVLFERLAKAGWRAAPLQEADGPGSLGAAFGIADRGRPA